MIDAYRGGGVATWKRIESDVRELGEHAVFATVRWNALDAEGEVLRDTRTTYHLLSDARRLALPVVHESLLGQSPERGTIRKHLVNPGARACAFGRAGERSQC